MKTWAETGLLFCEAGRETERGGLGVRKRKEENWEELLALENNWEKVRSSNGRKTGFSSSLQN